jgi:hypothetical protein
MYTVHRLVTQDMDNNQLLLAQLQGEEIEEARGGPRKVGDKFTVVIDQEHAESAVPRDPQHCTGTNGFCDSVQNVVPTSVKFEVSEPPTIAEPPYVRVRWVESDPSSPSHMLNYSGRVEPYASMRRVIDLTDSEYETDLTRLAELLADRPLSLTVEVTDARPSRVGVPDEPAPIARVRRAARVAGETAVKDNHGEAPAELPPLPAEFGELAAADDEAAREVVADAWKRGVETGVRKATGTSKPKTQPKGTGSKRTTFRRGGAYSKPRTEGAA